jgi:hypothetical protein
LNQYKPLSEKVAFELGKLQALAQALELTTDSEANDVSASLSGLLSECATELWRLLNGFESTPD